MADNERPLVDRVWEFTKDLSVKVSRKAEKHWKINTLRVEIASIKHRINVKYKELGRYVYESLKSSAVQEESYKATVSEFYDELSRLENDIVERENRIEILEQEMNEFDTAPPVPQNHQLMPHPRCRLKRLMPPVMRMATTMIPNRRKNNNLAGLPDR